MSTLSQFLATPTASTGRRLFALCLGSSLLLAGCGQGASGHKVSGRLSLPGGDVAVLNGHLIQAVGGNDGRSTAVGSIQPDGSFQLDQDAPVGAGVQPGLYKVRLVLLDDDVTGQRRARRTLDPKFFDAETSGWNVTVQGPQEVNLIAAVRPADIADPEPDNAPPGKTELPPNYFPTANLDSQ
jgi:hypothetical protein